MSTRLIEFFNSLRFKILAALFVVLTLSIGAAMFGIWIYERDQFVAMANDEARRGGRIIAKALRTSMLRNDKGAIQAAVQEIAALYEPPSRISIVAPDGGVAISSDPLLTGRTFDRFTSPSCIGCHRNPDLIPEKSAALVQEGKVPLLRNVIKIENEPQCYQCHPAATKILGVLLYDAYFTRTNELLKTVALRMFLTGLATLLVIGLVLFLAIDRFIQVPIRKLMRGFIEVGSGNYDCWVDEASSSEFGYMAEQFNIMSRAIGRFITEIKGKNQETAILYAIVREISETIDWERLKKIIVDLGHDIFAAEQSGLVVPHRKKSDCFDIVWRIKDEKRIGHLIYCLDSAELSYSGVSSEELAEWYRDRYVAHRFKDDFQRLLVPLHYSNQALGLICVKKFDGQSFSRHERAIIPALAKHVAISLANSQLYQMAITDGLTGLYSKRHLLNKLDMLVARHDKYAREAFFVLIMDLDHFKEVNDTHGHEVGDQVLMQLADLLRSSIRFGDIAFRYGGEEFVVLVPTVSDETSLGMEIAERLRAAVERHSFECREAPLIRKTISIGVASFPAHGKTGHEILHAADTALYQAKNNGRNRVRGASTPEKA